MEGSILINAVGYSNGLTYKLLEYDLSNLTGLIDDIDIWGFCVWCKFDKIIIE